jgi:hypothetical protein
LVYSISDTIPAEVRSVASGDLVERIALGVAAAADASRKDQMPESLMEALGTLDTPAIRRLLRLKLQSADPRGQAEAVAALLLRSDEQGLLHLAGQGRAIEATPEMESVNRMLRVMFRSSNPVALETLAVIAKDRRFRTDTREAAIASLRAVHARESLAFFAGLLDGDDASWRMEAVYAISAFANGAPIQTPGRAASMEHLHLPATAPFRTDETLKHFAFRRPAPDQEEVLVAFWRRWWIEHRAKLGF